MMKKLITVTILVTFLAFTIQIFQNIAKPSTATDSGCVTVYYDNSIDKPKSQCLSEAGYTDATSILNRAGYQLEGTQKYPDQIVCRVNNYPTKDTEKCINMPPANKYWAIIVNEKGKWDWAQVGINQIKLKPGQGIGLIYAINGTVNLPN